MKKLSRDDIIYLAAMMDAEGCISIGRIQRGRFKYGYQLNTEIANTYKSLIDWMKDVTGIGNISTKSGNEKEKVHYHWFLRVNELEEFLEIIEPFLKVKHRQAELMIEFLTTVRCRKSYQTPIEIDALRELIYEEMKELNKRGPNLEITNNYNEENNNGQ